MARKDPKLETAGGAESAQEKRTVRGAGRNGAPKANDAVKYRAYPTHEQYHQISKGIGNSRVYWNLIIDIAQITSELHKEGDPDIPYSIYPTPAEAKRLEGYEWLAETDTILLDNVKLNYEQSWKNHKEDPKKYGRPTWKKRDGLVGSYTTNNHPKWDKENSEYTTLGNIRIEDAKIYLPKVGWVTLAYHRPLPEGAIIKNVTVSRDAAGKIYVSIGYYNSELAEILANADIDATKETLIIEGLDYSNPLMFVTSEGLHPRDLHFYRESEKKLKKLQRKLARRECGSANYKKLSARIGRLHRHIANQRNDLLHKLSLMLAESCDIVAVEDLNLEALGRKKKGFRLSKNLYDNAWGKFLTYLEYKLARRGGVLVKVGRFFPSSKTCHHCGARYDELELSDREWDCPSCGARHDRDVNAAWNIMLEAVRLLRAGDVTGVGVASDVGFVSAGGAPVTGCDPKVSPVEGEKLGSSMLPVEGCKTLSGRVDCWSALLVGDSFSVTSDPGLSEAGKERFMACECVASHTEAPSEERARVLSQEG